MLRAGWQTCCVPLDSAHARAELCARLFAETTCDGVYSHGVNRFARFVSTVRNGSVDPNAEPKVVGAVWSDGTAGWTARAWESKCARGDGAGD